MLSRRILKTMSKSSIIFTMVLYNVIAEAAEKFIIYDNSNASKVSIAGEWNGWAGSQNGNFDPDTEPLSKNAQGKWIYSYTNLEPGLHEYKFIVDGNWEPGDNRKVRVEEDEGFGSIPSKTLVYKNRKARSVSIAGDWNRWAGSEIGKFEPEKFPMDKTSEGWSFNVSPLSPGRHEYKFIINGEWEPGANRILFVNKQRMLFRPVEVVTSALIDSLNTVTLKLRKPVKGIRDVVFVLDNGAKVLEASVPSDKMEDTLKGYSIDGGNVIFNFDEQVYNTKVGDRDELIVAGQFNNWGSVPSRSDWQLKKSPEGKWQLSKSIKDVIPVPGALQFKFVLNRDRWQDPPAEAPNVVDDGQGHNNLELNLNGSGSTRILLKTSTLDLSKDYVLTISNLAPNPVEVDLSQGKVFTDHFISDKRLGAFLDPSGDSTVFRVFAPRASEVTLYLYKTPEEGKPFQVSRLVKDSDGVWETTVAGKHYGSYYRYRVNGPQGTSERFDPNRELSDLYAVANVNHFGPSILLDPGMTDSVFKGWTDKDFQTPDEKNVVVSEIHVRDFTVDPSAKVSPENRAKYLGVIETIGKGTGIDELKDMGVNAVELMPVQEFDDNPPGTYHWGYMSTLYFAPESSYSSDPYTGKQVTELKKLVDSLHSQGMAVLLDVVYNHVGSPNYYSGYDNKYYFRFKDKYSYSNQSGCGNDVKTENPMVRKLILDNIAWWIKEYHVDGFRFDLAGLIDMDTLMAIRDTARKINPRAILVAEPWGGKQLKYDLKGTGWSAWNDDFRNNVKDFARGKSNRDMIRKVISGSGELWTANPVQSINYVESHDDCTLEDDLSVRTDKNGRLYSETEKSRNKLCAAILFTSLGVPMIAEGQELMRSKAGKCNSYNSGDEINSVKWDSKEKVADVYSYYRNLIRLRMSEKGKVFRVGASPSPEYYQWLYSEGDRGLGCVVNADGSEGKAKFVLLFNSDQELPVTFTDGLPEGKWIQIADDKTVKLDGLKDDKGTIRTIQGGKSSLTLPPISAAIFQSIE